MPDALALILALVVLAGTLAAAVSEASWASEAVVAVVGAALLVVLGALSPSQAWDALGDLAPTAAFLAALLVLAEACRRAGLFDALGTWLAAGSRGSPSRLLALVGSPGCASSASLLLPVSNLTNLLAFHASGLSFARFAALMAAPWVGAIAVEWAVLRRTFRADLLRKGRPRSPMRREPLPRFAVAVLALTLAGLCLSSLAGIEPLWVAVAGAVVLSLRVRATPVEVVRAASPEFVAFVLAASRTTWDPRASGTPSASSSTTRRARSYSSTSADARASRSWMPSLR